MSSAILDFERDCERARVTPAAVLRKAGLNPSNWPRWRSGESSPTLRSFDAARGALASLKTDEPGSHDGEVSVDDPAVVAPGVDLGADNPERNVSRTSATAFAHTQAAQAISKSDPAQCAGRSDAVVGSVAGDTVQSAAQDQAREGVAAGDPAGLAQLESSEVGEADLDPSSPADASDRLDAQAVAIADVDDRAGERLTGAQFGGHRPSVRDAGAGVSLRHARDCAESGGDESDPNHDGNLNQTEVAA